MPLVLENWIWTLHFTEFNTLVVRNLIRFLVYMRFKKSGSKQCLVTWIHVNGLNFMPKYVKLDYIVKCQHTISILWPLCFYGTVINAKDVSKNTMFYFWGSISVCCLNRVFIFEAMFELTCTQLFREKRKIKSIDRTVCLSVCGSVNIFPHWNLINQITKTELSSCTTAAGRQIFCKKKQKDFGIRLDLLMFCLVKSFVWRAL